MRPGTFFAALFLILLSSRLCHVDILWAEEDLPMAAATQMQFGKALYRDIWFDKPPLLASINLAWEVRTGWPLRLAGALYALLACWLAYRGRAFWSGAAAGVAMLINTKALFVLAACAVWCFPAVGLLAVGFAAVNVMAAAWLAWTGALFPYIDQVWRWGFLYAGTTFLEHPVRDGVIRTAAWLGFHGTLVVAAFWWLVQSRACPVRWKLLAWAALSLAAAVVGWRFFPRYFFQFLPVLVIGASRGMVLLGRKRALALVLLLIPLVRFGPRYVMLARDLSTGRPHAWNDVAMDQDSRAAARLAQQFSRPGDSLFVWGFRPDLWVYTGLPAATRFLDSQPLTGVPADRHLTQSAPVASDFTRANREELARSRPSIVIDGLSLFNPALAMDRYPELRLWLAQYQEIARTPTTVIYRLSAAPARPPLPEKR